MDIPHIEKSVFLKAGPEQVWQFLTEPNSLAQWFHPTHGPMLAGKTYGLYRRRDDRKPLCHGRVLETEVHSRLVYTFAHEGLEQHETRVEWTLSPLGEGTWLRLVHSGFETAPVDVMKALFEHDSGWDEHVLKLRDAVRQLEAEPA